MLTILLDISIQASRRASRSLARDWSELQMLQSTKPASRELYTMKAIQRGLELLQSELVEKSDFNVVTKLPQPVEGSKPVAHIMVLDGLRNLKRSMPYFATCVKVYDHVTGEIKAVVVNFPAFGEIIYAQTGFGVFSEKFRDINQNNSTQRMRVSRTEKMDEAVVSFSHSLSHEIIQEKITTLAISNAQIRSFGSNMYSAYMLISGKIDALFVAADDPMLPAMKIWLLEAGGRIHEDGKLVCLANNSLSF